MTTGAPPEAPPQALPTDEERGLLRDSVRGFAAIDGCPADPTEAGDATNPDLLVRTWSSCDGGTEVEMIEVDGAPHAWMGHATRTPRLVGEPYMALDASVTIIEFLLAHPRT